VGQQMRVIAPAARGVSITNPHQIDLVPHTRIRKELGQVCPLSGALR
jgi:hypothetical protein